MTAQRIPDQIKRLQRAAEFVVEVHKGAPRPRPSVRLTVKENTTLGALKNALHRQDALFYMPGQDMLWHGDRELPSTRNGRTLGELGIDADTPLTVVWGRPGWATEDD